MENAGIFYGHLEYFTAIWYILWSFGIVCGHLLYFSQFGMFEPRKIWQPWPSGLCACKRTFSTGGSARAPESRGASAVGQVVGHFALGRVVARVLDRARVLAALVDARAIRRAVGIGPAVHFNVQV
jgi:hypothetical protein